MSRARRFAVDSGLTVRRGAVCPNAFLGEVNAVARGHRRGPARSAAAVLSSRVSSRLARRSVHSKLRRRWVGRRGSCRAGRPAGRIQASSTRRCVASARPPRSRWRRSDVRGPRGSRGRGGHRARRLGVPRRRRERRGVSPDRVAFAQPRCGWWRACTARRSRGEPGRRRRRSPRWTGVPPVQFATTGANTTGSVFKDAAFAPAAPPLAPPRRRAARPLVAGDQLRAVAARDARPSAARSSCPTRSPR